MSKFPYELGDENWASYFWEDGRGNPHKWEMPHFYIGDTEKATEAMKAYLAQSRPIYLDKLLAGADPMTRRTFDEALRLEETKRVGLFD